MKKIIITLSIVFSAFLVQAQTAKKDPTGNYIEVTKESTAKLTDKTFTTLKGEVFKVYETDKGRLFVKRKSAKTGKSYNQYLKVN
jgi:hypothetical protein